MNIFKFEIKSTLKNSIIWTISLIATFMLFMIGIYPMFKDASYDIQKIFESYPKQFVEAFGLNVNDILSFGGYYSFSFNYIVIIGAIMAVYLGVFTFSREKRAKAQDFLFTKPVKRESIFLYKLLSNIVTLIIANIIFLIFAYLIYNSEGDFNKLSIGKFILASSSLLYTQIVFLSIGIFYAIFAKKIKVVSGIATGFGFSFFILSAIVNIIKEDYLNYISPFNYFNPRYVFENGSFEIKYVITAILITGVLLISSYLRYKNSDVKAV